MWRKFPYPYRAIVTISNDIDGLSFQHFVELHRFLNTSQDTALGQGLNLDVSDSFWFFSCKPEINDSFTYFDGLSFEPSRYAPLIRELVHEGLLDVLHTWGNFSQRGGFERKYAAKAFEEMTGWKRKPLIWSDHGDIHNLQNLGEGLGDRKRVSDGTGKEQTVLEYHSDLLTQVGIVFCWTGNHVTPVWGQERPIPFFEKIRAFPTEMTLPRKIIQGTRFFLQGTDQAPILRRGNLRDGYPIWFFTRYLADWSRTKTEDLGGMLSSVFLDDLERMRGITLILIHFGFGRQFPDLSPETISGLRELSQREQNGKILVMSTERLLLYLLAQRELQVEVLEEYPMRVLSLRWPPTIPESIKRRGAQALHGLTFYVDKPETCSVLYDGKPLPVHQNFKDEDGRYSVTINSWTKSSVFASLKV